MSTFYGTAADGRAASDPTPAFVKFIDERNYPCIGAKAAQKAGICRTGSYRVLGDTAAAAHLARDLRIFLADSPAASGQFYTFVAFFEGPAELSEEAFEALLWRHLTHLHRADDQPWDTSVSDDPASDTFGFSFGGQAFFVIGMHPGSARRARRFEWPTLVFNAHDQFEALRARGKFAKMQRVIRKRDAALQGEINPMVADFGTTSEARQYSGRAVPAGWRCPFHAQKKAP